MTRRIVVPSWSRLPPDLAVETGCTHAAFIPLGGRPLYQHVVEAHGLQRTPSQVVVVLPMDAPEDKCCALIDKGLTLQRLAQSGSIGQTVLAALDGVATGQAVAVHMADTLVSLNCALIDDAVYTQTRSDLYRWTTVSAAEAGRILVTHDRDDLELHTDPQQVCVGLFTFSDGGLLRDLLQTELESARSGTADPFFLALQQYSARRAMSLQPAHAWFDCGHVDTYYESRLGYQNLRHFNTLKYDPLRGLVTKTSTRNEQYRHQVRWYKQVPDSLAAYLPRIFDSSDADEPYVTMELLSIPTLSELFVNERMSPGAWNGVVETIARILSAFERYRYRTTLAPMLAEQVYVVKTRERLLDYLAQRPESANHCVRLPGGGALAIGHVLDTLDRFVAHNGLMALEALCPIHGDFCFSNLMYDPKARIVKMIDPRGEFGVPGIFGDARYDLAKLAHSFDGGYDFIVSDRFAVSVASDGALDLQLQTSTYHHRVKAIFDAVLFKNLPLGGEVRAIQALLFLSMLPLHADAPDRQLAMLATGLRLYAQALPAELLP